MGSIQSVSGVSKVAPAGHAVPQDQPALKEPGIPFNLFGQQQPLVSLFKSFLQAEPGNQAAMQVISQTQPKTMPQGSRTNALGAAPEEGLVNYIA